MINENIADNCLFGHKNGTNIKLQIQVLPLGK